MSLLSSILSSVTDQKQNEIRKCLLDNLLESTKACHLKFGDKKHLASDNEICVINLCMNIEAILSHGFRSIPLTKDLKAPTFKQMSNLITNKLSIQNNINVFWDYIVIFLSKHERERYSMLKNVNTDVGRGRAFIRGSLNEKSLERYFYSFIESEDLLKAYYEDWAFLRDPEKNCLLPDIAAGLGAVLFAINIDNGALNDTLPMDSKKPYMCNLKNEPVIEINNSVKNSVEETNGEQQQNILKKLQPTTSAVKTPEIISSFDEQNTYKIDENNELEDNGNKLIMLPNSQNNSPYIKVDSNHYLNIKRNSNLDNRPLLNNNDNIEVLIPITMAKDAVTIQEELPTKAKLINHPSIEYLQLENDKLKSQIKRYVNAVQSLKQNEKQNEQESNEKTQTYQNQIKLYENKLIQVAEMHSELIEFNEHLQKQLNYKDQKIKQLEVQLKQLRGDQNNDNDEMDDEFLFNINANVYLAIPSAFMKKDKKLGSYFVYQIYIKAGVDEWNLYKRYSEFLALHEELKTLDMIVTKFNFPPKKKLGNKDLGFVEKRRKQLEQYLRRVIRHWPELAQCSSRVALQQHLSFFRDSENNPVNSQRKQLFSTCSTSSSNSVSSQENHYNGL